MQQAAIEQNLFAGHLVQFYKRSEYLAETVAEFIQQGLGRSDGIIILATQEHWQTLQVILLQKNSGFAESLNSERLLFWDVHEVLQRILNHEGLNKAAFMNFIQSILIQMGNHSNVRVYAELVDLLYTKGRVNDARFLKDFWNEILQTNPRLSLMCAFQSDFTGDNVPFMTEAPSQGMAEEHSSIGDEEEDLYPRIAILEQRCAALQHDYQKKLRAESELFALKKQLSQAGKLSILGELCAGIAHELNNPLAIIAGSIRNTREMVARSPDAMGPGLQELLKRLDYIDDASRRMTRIVRNVLMFARQQDHSLVPLDIKCILQKSIDFMQPSLQSERIQLQLLLPHEELYSLGDGDSIQQAFVNIMTNARDALTSAASDQARMLRITAQLIHDQRMEISFRDSGIGMDEQTLGKIFYPFFTTKAIGKGTGLGLAISHGIITKHKGQIFCESKPGQGTLVRVILPLMVEPSTALRA
jgi:C4-dicarboxylate-specific signal transduction histidine kinase